MFCSEISPLESAGAQSAFSAFFLGIKKARICALVEPLRAKKILVTAGFYIQKCVKWSSLRYKKNKQAAALLNIL